MCPEMETKMSGVATIMPGKTTLSVELNTAAKVRLIRAEIGMYLGRMITVNETVGILAMLYDRFPNKEEMLDQLNTEILERSESANVE